MALKPASSLLVRALAGPGSGSSGLCFVRPWLVRVLCSYELWVCRALSASCALDPKLVDPELVDPELIDPELIPSGLAGQKPAGRCKESPLGARQVPAVELYHSAFCEVVSHFLPQFCDEVVVLERPRFEATDHGC